MLRARKKRTREEPEAERYSWPHRWLHALPHGAILLVKENGILIGKLPASDAWVDNRLDIEEYLGEHEDYGPGDYSIASYYNGAIRGEHLHLEIGEPESWRRGETRAETKAFVDAQRKRKKAREEYARDPAMATMKGIAEIAASIRAPSERRTSPQRVLSAGEIAQLAEGLRGATDPEGFRAHCQILRSSLSDENTNAVFREYRRIETDA
jgi:hypothetical protein